MKAVDVVIGTEMDADVSWAEVHDNGEIIIRTNGTLVFKFTAQDLIVNPEAIIMKGGGIYRSIKAIQDNAPFQDKDINFKGGGVIPKGDNLAMFDNSNVMPPDLVKKLKESPTFLNDLNKMKSGEVTEISHKINYNKDVETDADNLKNNKCKNESKDCEGRIIHSLCAYHVKLEGKDVLPYGIIDPSKGTTTTYKEEWEDSLNIEKISEKDLPINIDQGHGSCQRCLQLRLKDNLLRASEEYFQLCNVHFELIVKRK